MSQQCQDKVISAVSEAIVSAANRFKENESFDAQGLATLLEGAKMFLDTEYAEPQTEMQKPTSDYVSIQEAVECGELNITSYQLRRGIKEGKFPFIKIGSKYLVNIEQLKQCLAAESVANMNERKSMEVTPKMGLRRIEE